VEGGDPALIAFFLFRNLVRPLFPNVPTAIIYLVGTELRYNFQTVIRERVHVNASSPTGLEVEFDISLPQVPCSLLNIDANDPTGQVQSLHLDKTHHIWKHRIKVGDNDKIQFIGDRTKLEMGSTLKQEAHLIEELKRLNFTDDKEEIASRKLSEAEVVVCGSCYGAGEEGECCDTCDDVKRVYNRKGWHLHDESLIDQCKKSKAAVEEDGEGCNVHGIVALSTGGGSWHLAPGRSLDHLASENDAMSLIDILMKTFEQWNVSHTVHKLRFGEGYPGHVHQLDGITRTIGDSYGMYQYYFQVGGGSGVFFFSHSRQLVAYGL
jgi:endoplasmic reticulum-Golgi intermediate compartment protein 3